MSELPDKAMAQEHGCKPRSRGTHASSVPVNRREFFRSAARAGAGAALGGLGVLLAFSRRGGRSGANEDPCHREGICRGCGRAEECGLPQAISLREAMKGGQTGV
jgi:hypothetical protein